MSQLNLFYLGTCQATLDGTQLTNFHSVKVQGLLAYLALEAARPHTRETLMTLFWPDDAPQSAQQSLRQALYALRRTLGDSDNSTREPFLLVTRQTIQLNPASQVTVDVTTFLQQVQQGNLAQAVALYQADLLVGMNTDSAPFGDWLRATREYHHNLALNALDQLTQQRLDAGDYDQAATYARRQLSLEPWREEAHRQLMTALALSNERSAALAQYETCQRVLVEELGVEPSAETTMLYTQIRAGQLAGKLSAPVLVSALAAQPVVTPPKHNLPPQPTPFIGRTQDLAQLTERLRDPTCRLLTIVGPGGMGKTRLAIQTAQLQTQAAPSRFADGIFFVALAGVASPDLLVSTIATALDFTFYDSGEPQAQLLAYLHKRSLLLVLDNCEHLLDGIELVSDLLGAAPQVKVLATSREPLNLHEEWLHPLSGMSFPGDGGTAQQGSGADLADYTAVQLFTQCARRMKPSFNLMSERVAVVRICRLVGGMPLGIEMAAVWLKHSPCDQIADQIERNVDFLTTTLRNVPARHRSMRAVFEHSWHLLSPSEQQVLQRVAVFRSGFRLEAAEQVAAASFPLLVALAEKSLVQSTPSGRYQMHELLRQFAEEKLQALPHAWSAVQERHGHYYLLFLQQHRAGLAACHSAAVVDTVEEEIENIRLAWQWVLHKKNAEAISLGLESLHLFFWRKHWYQEGETLFAQTASILIAESTAGKQELLLGRCLAVQAHLLNLIWVEVGQSPSKAPVESLCQQSLAILQRCNAAVETVLVLLVLGAYYKDVGKVTLGLSLQQQALATLSTQDNTLWLRRILHDVGHGHFWLGHYDTALAYFQRCIDLCEECDDLITLGDALDMIGMVHQARGDYDAALRDEQAALVARTTAGDKRGIGWSLQLLGEIAWNRGDYATAQQRSQESLALFTEIGTPRQGNAALNTLGNVAWSRGDYTAARRYFRIVLASQIAPEQLTLNWTGIMALTGLGAVLWKEGAHQQAVELLTHVLRHPAGLQETKQRATLLLAELTAALPTVQFEEAQQRAETQDVTGFVAKLLTENSVDRLAV